MAEIQQLTIMNADKNLEQQSFHSLLLGMQNATYFGTYFGTFLQD
jgi:hypothetical protein